VYIDEYIEGSVHKGSITIYFRFLLFYTVGKISTTPTKWRQPFSDWSTRFRVTKQGNIGLKRQIDKSPVHKGTTEFCEHTGYLAKLEPF